MSKSSFKFFVISLRNLETAVDCILMLFSSLFLKKELQNNFDVKKSLNFKRTVR